MFAFLREGLDSLALGIGYVVIVLFLAAIITKIIYWKTQRSPTEYSLPLLLSSQARQNLESLRVLSEKVSYVNIIASALDVYHFLWKRVQQGYTITLESPEGETKTYQLP